MFAWLVLALFVAAGSGAGLLWLFGWPRLPATSAFSTAEVLDLLKIALAVVAGLGGVVLLAVNLRKQRVTEAEHGLAQAKDQREKDQSYNERFGAAAEQLAHDNAAVRLAGVYAMAGLGDDWLDNRQICVDVLCGYLRLPVDEGDVVDRKVRETLLRVLRDRLAGVWSRSELDLDFTAARLGDADIATFTVRGFIRFDNAVFEGEYFVLGPSQALGSSYNGTIFRVEETRFERTCHLQGAEFDGGRLVFDSRRTKQAARRLKEAGFRAEPANFEFTGCRFVGVTFVVSGPQWMHGAVRFRGCGFVDCSFEFSELAVRARPIEGSVVNGGVFDLRGVIQGDHFLWLVDTELDRVKFLPAEDPDLDPVKTFNIRRVTLNDTVLPERHLRDRGDGT